MAPNIDLNPIVKGILEVALGAAGIPAPIVGGTYDAFQKTIRARRVNSAGELPSEFVRSVRDFAKNEDISDEEVSLGLTAAREAIERLGPSNSELVAVHNMSSAEVTGYILGRSWREQETLSEGAKAVMRLGIRKTYSLLFQPVTDDLAGELANQTYQTTRRLLDWATQHAPEDSAGRDRIQAQAANRIFVEGLVEEAASRPYVGIGIIEELQQSLAGRWNQILEQHLRTLDDFCHSQKISEDVRADLRSLVSENSFLNQRRALARLDLLPLFMQLDIESSMEQSHSHEKALKALEWIERQIRNPTYETVLAVCGPWGAGRTRLASELFISSAAEPRVVLRVRMGSLSSLTDGILSSVRDQWGISFDSTQNFYLWLSGDGPRNTTIFLDDFESILDTSERVLDDFISEVELSAIGGGPTWVVVCDTLRFDRMWAKSRGEFWHRFCLRPKLENNQHSLGGWIDLQSLNAAKLTGNAIIRRNLPLLQADQIFSFAEHDADLTTFYSDPGPAWIQVEESRRGDGGGALRSNVFEVYLQARVEAISSPFSSRELTEILDVLSIGFVSRPSWIETRPSVNEVIDFARGATESPRLAAGALSVADALDVLVRVGLLSTGRTLERTTVHFLPALIWGHLIAKQVSETFATQNLRPDEIIRALQLWNGRALSGDALAEYVLYCLLESFDWSLTAGDEDAQEGFVEAWLSAPASFRRPIFNAGITAPKRVQRAILRWLNSNARPLGARQDVYHFFRFIMFAHSSVIRGHRRLEEAAFHYSAAGRLGLGDHVRQLVSQCASETDFTFEHEREGLFDALAGVEATGRGEAILGDVVRFALDDYREAGLEPVHFLADVQAYLSTSRMAGGNDRFPPHIKGRAHQRSWQLLVSAVLAQTLSNDVDQFLRDLENAGWIQVAGNAVFSSRVSAEMRAAINIRLGSVFRHGGRGQVADLEEVLSRLLEGRLFATDVADQVERAIYIVRHSLVIGRSGGSLQVGVRLLPVLRRIVRVEGLSQSGQRCLDELRAANGLDARRGPAARERHPTRRRYGHQPPSL